MFHVFLDGETTSARAARLSAVPPLSAFERGVVVGVLIGEGSFGGDGKQPQVTLRMHVRHEALFRWLIARFPRVRDRAIFVGSPEDVVPHDFGPGLPPIRPWVEQHFDFSGYVLAPDAGEPADREALRSELGYRPDERICLVTVGGSGVGTELLSRVIDAFPDARRRVPDLRMIVVCGPRIDPDSLPHAPGLEVLTYVHGLSRHLAACDLAVVQGGLSTCMELAAAKRPFLYFPLKRHFEQNLHVRHRLDRYRAGRALDFEAETAETIAAAIAESLTQPPATAEVERDGAANAAALIAAFL